MKRARYSKGGGLLLLGVALAGCLFPSFDELGANKAATTDREDARAPAATSSTPSATATTTTTAPPVTVDAGPDVSAPPLPKSVPCRGVNPCTPPQQYCCANMILDDECKGSGDDPELLCADQAAGNARAMRCDGPEDCGSGLVCCFVDAANAGASCVTTCAATTMCHDNTHCPVGTTCTGRMFDEYSFCR